MSEAIDKRLWAISVLANDPKKSIVSLACWLLTRKTSFLFFSSCIEKFKKEVIYSKFINTSKMLNYENHVLGISDLLSSVREHAYFLIFNGRYEMMRH